MVLVTTAALPAPVAAAGPDAGGVHGAGTVTAGGGPADSPTGASPVAATSVDGGVDRPAHAMGVADAGRVLVGQPGAPSLDGPTDALGRDVTLLFDVFSGGLDAPGLVVLLGYSRYDDSDPLENEPRATVYEAVRRSPGTFVAEVSDRTDVPRSTVRYHVRVLTEEGLLFSEKIRGRQRLFPAENDDVELTAALVDDATRPVLLAVARQGPASVSALADDLDRAPSTVSYHLSRLADAGLVEQDREDGATLTRLAPDVAARLAVGSERSPPAASAD